MSDKIQAVEYKTLQDGLKVILGYTEVRNTCITCRFVQLDPSTDNFGPGDKCFRNPDIQFPVASSGCCAKFTSKFSDQK